VVSDKFLAALKRSDLPAYRLAARAGVSPSWFSKALHGAVRTEPSDSRFIAIGRLLGLGANEVFHDEPRAVAHPSSNREER
jgi:hypothetical protein